MKQNAFLLKCVIVAFLVGILLITAGIHFLTVSHSQTANVRDKRVVSVMVEKEDTIWTIARKYYTEECGSMKQYVEEIKKCNSLENDTIYAGYPLIVPVWVSEDEAIKLLENL